MIGERGVALVRRIRGCWPQDVWSELSCERPTALRWAVSWRALLEQRPQAQRSVRNCKACGWNKSYERMKRPPEWEGDHRKMTFCCSVKSSSEGVSLCPDTEDSMGVAHSLAPVSGPSLPWRVLTQIFFQPDRVQFCYSIVLSKTRIFFFHAKLKNKSHVLEKSQSKSQYMYVPRISPPDFSHTESEFKINAGVNWLKREQ